MPITLDKTTPNKMSCEATRPANKHLEESPETKESMTPHSNNCGCGHHAHKSLLSLGTLNTTVETVEEKTPQPEAPVENSQSQTDKDTKHIHSTECAHHQDTEEALIETKEHIHGPNCTHNHHEITSSTKKSNNLFPLEETIKGLNTNKTIKQILTMVSNLTPAMTVSEIAGAFHLNSLIASPLAISAMHLTNRGTNNEHLPKLFLTALSSLGVISAQKFVNLPRLLIRPFMALAVFFIEKNGKPLNSKEIKSEMDNKSHKEKFDFNVSKGDWINLLKLQGQINTIPWLANLFTGNLKELNEENSGINKVLGKIGISALHIVSLSLGFTGLGALIDKSLTYFKVVSDKESIAMRAEGAVCACCGAPVCVAEAASEAGAMSLAV